MGGLIENRFSGLVATCILLSASHPRRLLRAKRESGRSGDSLTKYKFGIHQANDRG